MKKTKIIVIAIVVAIIVACLVSIKYLPFWSTILIAIASAGSFVAGWFAKKWYDENVKEE